jgi:hypothetical protein
VKVKLPNGLYAPFKANVRQPDIIFRKRQVAHLDVVTQDDIGGNAGESFVATVIMERWNIKKILTR